MGAAITAHDISVGFAGQCIPVPDLGPTFFCAHHEIVLKDSKSHFCVGWSHWWERPLQRMVFR